MNTRDLTNILRNKVKSGIHLLGVLASDQLPKKVIDYVPAVAIINTEPSTMGGEHWLAVFINKNREGFFFDSYGRKASYRGFPRDINDFLRKNCTRVYHSTKKVQADTSTVCGQHCVFFILHIQRGLSYQKVIDMYKNNVYCNDAMVCKFVDRIQPAIFMRCNRQYFPCIQCAHGRYI